MDACVDPARLYKRLPAVAPSVVEMRHAVVDYAAEHGASPERQGGIALAVSEAATNVVLHAYIDAPQPGPLIVCAWREDEHLLVEVSDEGRGMRPRPDSPGLGLGIPLMADACINFEVCTAEDSQDGTGTRLRLCFALP